MSHKGIDPGEGCSGIDFIDREADGSDGDSSDEREEDTDSSLSDLFDETDQAQGNSLLLFQQQQAADDEKILSILKRKHDTTPDTKALQALSPKLDAMRISPPRRIAKKKLVYSCEDSGVGVSVISDEVASIAEAPPQVEGSLERGSADGSEGLGDTLPVSESSATDIGTGSVRGSQTEREPVGDAPKEKGSAIATAILQAKNRRVCMLHEFKQLYEVSFVDLVHIGRLEDWCKPAPFQPGYRPLSVC
uniref:E6 protein n=1 Tax=Eidolon bat papillomavirus TaxID=3141875 RepID=A0AAU7E2X8_9PAPI